MIVLSVGMPRAGSGWFFNLTNDLLVASGFEDVRHIRQRYYLGRVLTEVNCNIGAFTSARLLAVYVPSLLGNTFTVKSHAGPTPMALRLIRGGALVPTYIYRDPRDALLSAMEYGQRGVDESRPNAFSNLTDFGVALDFMLDYLRIWEAWMGVEACLQCRYEDMLRDYESQVGRLVEFLNFDRNALPVQKVIDKYRPEATPGEIKGMHFSQGKTGRFRERMSAEQQERMAEAFGSYLGRMGYEVQ